MKCEFCQTPIQQGQDYRVVQGYERIHRDAGGTNALRLRKPLEQFACRWCVDKQANGISVDQASML
jgi:hypothetical protein